MEDKTIMLSSSGTEFSIFSKGELCSSDILLLELALSMRKWVFDRHLNDQLSSTIEYGEFMVKYKIQGRYNSQDPMCEYNQLHENSCGECLLGNRHNDSGGCFSTEEDMNNGIEEAHLYQIEQIENRLKELRGL